MYIMNLENGFKVPKYMIYATALLHDIGRGEQYKNGTPHDIASVKIARNILLKCKYDSKEIEEILEAIGKHRNNTENLASLSHLLYKGDKLSRNCFYCRATYDCKWTAKEKNFNITY